MALAPPAATTTNAARKEIIRSVLDEITVLARGHSELVDLTLTWAGGQTGQITTRRSLQRLEDLSYYPQLADAGMTPESIVIRLRAEGYRHSRDDCDIGWRAVEQILLRTGHTINRSHQPRRVHPDQAPHDNEWWLADLAAELGVTGALGVHPVTMPVRHAHAAISTLLPTVSLRWAFPPAPRQPDR